MYSSSFPDVLYLDRLSSRPEALQQARLPRQIFSVENKDSDSPHSSIVAMFLQPQVNSDLSIFLS